jgi:hypothetical protein
LIEKVLASDSVHGIGWEIVCFEPAPRDPALPLGAGVDSVGPTRYPERRGESGDEIATQPIVAYEPEPRQKGVDEAIFLIFGETRKLVPG